MGYINLVSRVIFSVRDKKREQNQATKGDVSSGFKATGGNLSKRRYTKGARERTVLDDTLACRRIMNWFD